LGDERIGAQALDDKRLRLRLGQPSFRENEHQADRGDGRVVPPVVLGRDRGSARDRLEAARHRA